jgi:hypothetical protein
MRANNAAERDCKSNPEEMMACVNLPRAVRDRIRPSPRAK